MNIKQIISTFLLLIFSTISFAADGIGGIIGGSGKTWKDEMRNSRSYIAWPEIDYPNSPRSYKIHELCIKDENTLMTIKKMVRFKWTIKDWKLEKEYLENGQRELERVFDGKNNCQTSNFFNCDIQGAYVPKNIDVPIYRVNDTEEPIIHLLHINRPKDVATYSIPSCN